MSKRAKVNLDLPTGIENIEIATVFTSKPYPVVVVDAVGSQAAVDGLRGGPSTVEAVSPAASLDALSLRAILQSYGDGDPEAVQPQGGISALELDTVLIEYTDGDPEALQPQGAISALELRPQRVEYTNGDPEAVQPQGSLDGLALN